MTVKSDTELLAALGQFLQRLGPKLDEAIVLTAPLPGLDDAEHVDRALVAAEEKWFVDRIVRARSKDGPKWTFDLTTRGAEAFHLD